MFRRLDYQDKAIDALDRYLDHLNTAKARADRVAARASEDPSLGLSIRDHTREAWDALKEAGKLPASRARIPFSPRADGCARPVPNVVLKVPTGGGKTWLAVMGVSRIMSRYLGRNAGFVL